MAQYELVTCTINGKKVEKVVDVRASLTDMLRNDYRLTSVKKGCEVGECGACTALIDGEAINTCLYLAVWAEGKDIITLEGLMNPDGTLSDVQKAFMEETSIQCGFCIPGFILTATEIVNSGKEYTDDELRKLLSGHLSEHFPRCQEDDAPPPWQNRRSRRRPLKQNMPNVPLCQEGDVSCLYAMHLVGADDFAQLFATKERYRCGMPLAGTVRPSPPQRRKPPST